MRLRGRITLPFLWVFLAFATALPAQAPAVSTASASDPWSSTVRAFAEKIAAAMGAPRTISLAVKNISDLDAARVSRVDSDLRAELSRAGFQVSAAGAEEIEVNVTLSKNVDGYVWVAEIRSQAGEQVVIEAVKQPQAAQESARTAPVLRK